MSVRHRQIEAFRAVMVAGTVTEAGKLLRISQPSVSRLIGDLERSLDLALFERRHGRVSPTPEAIRLFEEVERSFHSLDKLVQFAREIQAFRGAQLTIAGMPALCLDLLPQAVGQFLQHHPQAHVSVHARSSQQIVEWIASQQCELGLAGPPFDVRGVAGEMLVRAPSVCVLPPGHRLAARQEITPQDLADEPIIHTSSAIVRHRLERVFGDAGVAMRSRIETPLSIVACRHVELGLGVAICEPYTARYCAGRDIVLRRFAPAVPFDFGILSPEGRPRSLATQELLHILRQTIENLDLPCGLEAAILPFAPQP